MGKSPGKWIRTLLFRKKGSGATKGRETLKVTGEKDVWISRKERPSEVAVDSFSTPLPVAANVIRNGEISELEELTSNITSGGILLPTDHDAENQETIGPHSSNNSENFKEELAAIRVQAIFRGYLARRAFRVLKGIIRLQALIRGHLVRRQAVATLHCLHGIVKLQALVRGRRVRHSEIGVKIQKTGQPEKAQDSMVLGVHASLQVDKQFANSFISKLLSSSPTGVPLEVIQYGLVDPNSAWSWLERWTHTLFLKPLAQHKGGVASKGQTKQGTIRAVETGRPKRDVQKNHAVTGSSFTHLNSESAKPKRVMRKISSHVVDSQQEHPENELRKVKHHLRKVSSSTTNVPGQVGAEAEKPKQSLKRMASTEISHNSAMHSMENAKNISTVPSTDNLDVETALKPVANDGPADMLHDDHSAVELQLSGISRNEGNNISVVSGELMSNEDQVSHERSKNRRTSFPVKPECSENGLRNTPTLPSYMAATESAKAKLREQGSPRFGHDEAEKNGLIRRHSLPSTTSGKVKSPAARAQKLVQANGKGATKSDRSMLSSRDGNEKVIQAEWRR